MNIDTLRKKNLIIFEGIVGSHAYGIATEKSDKDIKGVYIQEMKDILRDKYVEQVNDARNDVTFYEITRFLQLLRQNNPNILELLYLPSDCIISCDPLFDLIMKNRDSYLSKTCRYSFGGYAIDQIKKARGLNKKIVSPIDEKRKGVLDFCYVPYDQGSILVREYLSEHGMDQRFCGLSSIPHMRYTYGVYYDKVSHLKEKGIQINVNREPFKGIVQDEDLSNDVSLSIIPPGIQPNFIMQFNRDAYEIHCREYKEYWNWVEMRNPERFSDNMLNGKGYDGKNLAHCHRLLDMAIEIAKEGTVNVRRPNREKLLSIRKGEYEYDQLIEEAESKILEMNDAFDRCSLPERVDNDLISDLLLRVRKQRYILK